MCSPMLLETKASSTAFGSAHHSSSLAKTSSPSNSIKIPVAVAIWFLIWKSQQKNLWSQPERPYRWNGTPFGNPANKTPSRHPRPSHRLRSAPATPTALAFGIKTTPDVGATGQSPCSWSHQHQTRPLLRKALSFLKSCITPLRPPRRKKHLASAMKVLSSSKSPTSEMPLLTSPDSVSPKELISIFSKVPSPISPPEHAF